jgi:hypothetical protein
MFSGPKFKNMVILGLKMITEAAMALKNLSEN